MLKMVEFDWVYPWTHITKMWAVLIRDSLIISTFWETRFCCGTCLQIYILRNPTKYTSDEICHSFPQNAKCIEICFFTHWARNVALTCELTRSLSQPSNGSAIDWCLLMISTKNFQKCFIVFWWFHLGLIG